MSDFWEDYLNSVVEATYTKLVLTDPENQRNKIRNSFIKYLQPLEVPLVQREVIAKLSTHEDFVMLLEGKIFNYIDYFSDITNPSLEELTLFELDRGQEEMNKYLEIIKNLYVEF